MNEHQQDIRLQIAEKLTQIGFTQLESEVYLQLLITGSNTGYAIAKGIGKPVANVYKAIESLSNKGAVENSMAESKICTAVPWQQLLSIQKKSFTEKINSISKSLEKLPAQQQDEKVYQLSNLEHVLEQSIRLVEEADHIVLADIEPEAVEWLQKPLVNAAKRGVEVRIKVYQPIELEGVKVTLRQRGEEVYAKTRDISFSLCADGKLTMLALVTADKTRVIQAFRTQSSLMSLSIYYALLYGVILTDLKTLIPQGKLSAAKELLIETEHLHPFSSENNVFSTFRDSYQNFR